MHTLWSRALPPPRHLAPTDTSPSSPYRSEPTRASNINNYLLPVRPYTVPPGRNAHRCSQRTPSQALI
ncbi:hypothetical protein C2E23DRAFT_826142 [Lenzites betulinus]|nr:hypothetical protein C2E23DRAFT_826142 [Lenzites betulinus]